MTKKRADKFRQGVEGLTIIKKDDYEATQADKDKKPKPKE